MPDPISAGIGAITSIGGGLIQSKSAKKASRAQVQSADMAAAEQRAAREEMRRLLEPYVNAGGPALQAQMGALGLLGDEAQQAFVSQQERSPIFQAFLRQGEDAMLQNASATGGLRGGNVQGALAQFRPAMLNQFLENQYAKLGGMTALGQNSAAGVGASGIQVAGNIGNLLQQAGAARAGGALAQGNAWGGVLNNLGGLAGLALGGGGLSNMAGLQRLNASSQNLIGNNPGIF